MMIVGFTGYAGSGKDTAAQCLLDRGWHHRKFAMPLKQAVLTLDPLVSDTTRLSELVDMKGWDFAKQFPEVRRLLQVFGTDVARKLWYDDFWVERMECELAEIPGDESVVITDVRFPNEAALIKYAMYGVVIRISRDGCDASEHESETMVDQLEVDYTIDNNGTIEQLHQQVLEITSGMDSHEAGMDTDA